MESLNGSSRLAKRQTVRPLRRACEPCRSLKVRCLFDNVDSSQCASCLRLKRRCIVGDDHRYPKNLRPSSGFTPPLEKQSQQAQSNSNIQSERAHNNEDSEMDDRDSVSGLFPFLFSDKPKADSAASGNNPIPADVIDRGMLDTETASTAFTYFITTMACRLPLVTLAPDISFTQCRRTTPVLFLSVLVVGLSGNESDLQACLLDEFYKIIANEIVYQGQKRLELVQALLVTWMWMTPPARLGDMKISMMAHLVASMIQDLRITGALHSSSSDGINTQKYVASTGIQDSSATTIDDRTHLGAYVACAIFSSVFKQPTIIPFIESVSQSLESVRSSLDASPTNRVLVAWVELERIAIDLAEAKSTIPNPIPSNLRNLKGWIVRSFESRLYNWKASLRVDVSQDVALLMEYHTIMLNVNLLSISDGRPAIAPPFTEDMIFAKLPITDLTALGKCVGSAQAVLDLFSQLTPVEIPSMPAIIFPRMVHALLILIVATLAILGPSSSTSTAQYDQRSKDVASLQFDQYISHISEIFRKSSSPENGRARKALKALTLLRKWYAKIIPNDRSPFEPSIVSTTVNQESGRLPKESRDMTMIGTLPTSLNSQPEKFIAGSPAHIVQQPTLSDFDNMLESGDLFPLRDDQLARFTSLIEQPGGPPWTLFDDAMVIFDFM